MRILYSFFLSLLVSGSFANHGDSTISPKIVDCFKKGHFSGQIRNFSMATINHNDLTDYYASAIGASVHYETLPFKGFSIGLNGIFVYRLFSNDLLKVDPVSFSTSKYELQLFDIEHKGNFNDLDRLEELYIKYEHQSFRFVVGKMEIVTPLVNLHDGRMKPKVFSGFKSSYQIKENDFTVAWFTGASPRSTTHWYRIEDAIGLYSNGSLPNGTPAQYHKKLSSNGLGLLGWKHKNSNGSSFEIWEYYLDNISNTTMVKIEKDVDSSLYSGFIYLNQFGIGNGGSVNKVERYHDLSDKTHAISGRIGYHFSFCDLQLNGTHIFDKGKFIFPREFGVDPFYTFISRSQIEGFGDATSIGVSLIKKIKKATFNIHWNRMLTNDNLKFNKYQLSSYDQFNLDCNYTFRKKLEGLELRFLYVYRRSLSKNIIQAQEHNKTNFNQFNLVANFNF